MQVLNRLRNTETCSDDWANRVLPEIHLCSLSRVYQEQRTESGYILYLPRAVFLLEVWLGQIACCSAWWQGSLFQEKSWHALRRRCGSLWICSGAGCLLGWIYVEGLNDPAFLPQPKSWFHLVPVGKREQSWPRIVVALRDILMGEVPVTVLSYLCFARWDGDVGHHSHLPALSAVQGGSSSGCPLGIRLLAVLAFSTAVLACLCPYLAFVLGMLMTLQRVIVVSSMLGCCRVTFCNTESQCEFVLSTIVYPPGLNFYPFNSAVEFYRFLNLEYSGFPCMQWIWGIRGSLDVCVRAAQMMWAEAQRNPGITQSLAGGSMGWWSHSKQKAASTFPDWDDSLAKHGWLWMVLLLLSCTRLSSQSQLVLEDSLNWWWAIFLGESSAAYFGTLNSHCFWYLCALI